MIHYSRNAKTIKLMNFFREIIDLIHSQDTKKNVSLTFCTSTHEVSCVISYSNNYLNGEFTVEPFMFSVDGMILSYHDDQFYKFRLKAEDTLYFLTFALLVLESKVKSLD